MTTPDVIGLPQATAESTLLAADLLVGRVSDATHPTIPAGSVSGQNPIGGSVAEFGAEVDLVVSLGPAPEDVDNDGDGFTENQGDCNDADATIFPGAPDPNGDGIDQNCDGFDGTEPVAEVVVEPARLDLLAGESRQLRAWAIFGDGTAQIATAIADWQSTNGATATVSATGRVTAVAGNGPAQITATVDATVGSANVTVTDVDGSDDDAPTVEITSPEDGDSVFGPIDVIGTADDPNLVRYELLISPAGEESFTKIGDGTSPVVGGALGQLDPALILNGLYNLRLTVLDAGGNETSDEIGVQVDGQLKVGNFTLTYTDVEVPVSGIPLRVQRTYDSRDKRRGDFGVGWRLGFQTLELTCTEPLGRGWYVARSGLTFGLIPTRAHRCSIVVPGRRAEQFEFEPSPMVSPLVPFSFLRGSFRPLPGTTGTLEVVDGAFLAITDPQPGEVTLLDDADFSPFAPQRFRYTTREGTVVELGPDGVERIEDRNGNSLTLGAAGITHSSGKTVTFHRDDQGRIVELVDPLGNVQVYRYSAAGDLVSHQDAAGNVTRFYYDDGHFLLTSEDPLGRRPGRFEYDDDGRLVRLIDASGNVTRIDGDAVGRREVLTDRLGFVRILELDARGNPIREVDPLGGVTQRVFDGRDNLLQETDPLGHTTTMTYNAFDEVVQRVDPLGNVETFTYDDLGRVLTETDEEGGVVTRTYDSRGNQLSITDQEGHVTRWTYTSTGEVETFRERDGGVTTFAHDGNGNVISEVDPLGHVTTFTYDARGDLLSETTTRTAGGQARQMTTSYTYDAVGRLTSTTHPDGSRTQEIYDAADRKVAEVDELGRRTDFEYDVFDQLTATIYDDGSRDERTYDAEGRLVSRTDREGREHTFAHDALGRMIRATKPGGDTRTYTYDDAGRQTSRTDLRGGVTERVFDADDNLVLLRDALGNETIYGYDAVGNPGSETDANGHQTRYEYDGRFMLVRVIFPDGSEQSFTYDELGRPTSVTDPAGRTTTLAYDPASILTPAGGVLPGRLTSVTDALGATWSFAWDEADNLISQTDPNGHVTRWEHDDRGRTLRQILPLGMVRTWTYDAAGNKVSETDYNGQTLGFEHDAFDRLTRKILPGGGEVRWTFTAEGEVATTTDARGVTSYAYDGLGRLTGVTDPDGVTLSYTYDADNNLTSVTSPAGTVSYAYDLLGRLMAVNNPAGATTTYAYDPVGNLLARHQPNGTSAEHAYDSRNRLVGITHRAPDSSVLASYSYVLGPAGNVLGASEANGRTVDYAYDAALRLTGEQIADPVLGTETLTYAYDAVGNRLSATDASGTTAYAYDANDRLLSAGGVSFTYDANGNVTSRTEGGVTTSLTWDVENRLAALDAPGQTISYAYDADGVRVGRVIDGVATRFVVDKHRPFAQVLEERDSGGGLLASYARGHGLISQTRGGETHYYHPDRLGTTRLLTDAAGRVSDSYLYEAFGSLLDADGTTVNPFLYTGEQREEGLGLYFLRARYLDPSVGRFLSVDPFEGFLAQPESLPRYLYAFNDPVRFVDPSGEAAIALNPGSPLSDFSLTNAIGGIVRSAGLRFGAVLAKLSPRALALTGTLTFAELQLLRRKNEIKKRWNHHGIEKRWLKGNKILECAFDTTDQILSILITRKRHQRYTNRARSQAGYKKDGNHIPNADLTCEKLMDIITYVYAAETRLQVIFIAAIEPYCHK